MSPTLETIAMTPTFETVLRQAKALPVGDRRRLVEALNKPNGHKKSAKKWDDDPTIKSLRVWVDKIVASTDPEIKASIEIAEQIRTRNDRKFEL